MSYELLNGLYFSEAANADLTSPAARQRLHLETPLEALLISSVNRGLDVVLTGNPGDGKSHLVRTLADRGALERAVVEPDLSARATEDVLEAWRCAARDRRPFVMCANEGPLTELIGTMRATGLAAVGGELAAQLGRLLVFRPADLPPQPERVLLVDLADRAVLTPALVERAIARVATEDFLPPLQEQATETSAGRNILLLHRSREVRMRLARALTAAGQRLGEHVTFRQLWGAIAYAVTRVRRPAALRQELAEDRVGIDSLPLANLVHGDGRGDLLGAARMFADVARVTDPDLDEHLWSTGRPSSSDWLPEVAEDIDAILPQLAPPAALWRAGRREEAMATLAQLKRMVALLHGRGEVLINELSGALSIDMSRQPQELRAEVAAGLRSLFVAPTDGASFPDWVRDGVPLWVGLSYEFERPETRPHVAVSARRLTEFEILRPHRAPWLGDALGPLPSTFWFFHTPSRIALQVDASLLSSLQRAARTSGPLPLPDVVQRFMARLAGWEERQEPLSLGRERAVVIAGPRGPMLAEAGIQLRGEEASYAVG
jgi:hypothetical protein